MKNDMQFTGKNGEFQIRHMVEKTQLNFPVANEEGIKSSVTQTFGGCLLYTSPSPRDS